MFKYTEKVGEKMVTYEADTAQNVADLVNVMNSNKSTPINATEDSVVIGPLS